MGKEVITQLQGKETGLREHGEFIKVHVIAYEKLWRATADAKTLVAIALYEMAKKEGLVPPLSSSSASSWHFQLYVVDLFPVMTLYTRLLNYDLDLRMILSALDLSLILCNLI